MRPPLLQLCLGIGLLGSPLAAGCQHSRPPCPLYHPRTIPVAAATPAKEGPALGSPDEVSFVPDSTRPTAAPAPTRSRAAEPARAPGAQSARPPAPRVVPDTLPAGEPAVAPPEAAAVPAANPRCGHDPAYRWVVGTLDYSTIQKAWVVRYASAREEDRFGGAVTLVDPGPMKNFAVGQLVRVEGHLIDPQDTQPRAPYRVQSLRPAGPEAAPAPRPAVDPE